MERSARSGRYAVGRTPDVRPLCRLASYINREGRMAADTTKPLTMTQEQVSRFHEVLRGERTFRWDAACSRIPGRSDGAAGLRIKRKEAEAIDEVIGKLDGLL